MQTLHSGKQSPTIPQSPPYFPLPSNLPATTEMVSLRDSTAFRQGKMASQASDEEGSNMEHIAVLDL
jgi:hypothetical protein